jgi:hypothetical protein
LPALDGAAWSVYARSTLSLRRAAFLVFLLWLLARKAKLTRIIQ